MQNTRLKEEKTLPGVTMFENFRKIFNSMHKRELMEIFNDYGIPNKVAGYHNSRQTLKHK